MFGITYNYDYDDDGEVFKIKYSGARSGTISTDKDEKKRIKNKTHTFGDGTALSYAYTYEDYPDETVSSITMADKFTQSVSYDSFQRLRSIKIISNGGFNYSETYSYLSPYKSGCTLQYINIIDYTIGTNTETDNYEYDEDGNIKSITTGRGEITYEYDGLNRLVQEINNVTKKKYNFTYDAGGNILTQKVTNLYSMQVEKELWYYYDKSNKDRLVNINGVGISGYDMQGRPSYYRGWNLGWKNGRVNTFTKGNSTHTCEYDANGIRVKKIANGLQHEYYLEDDKIVREVVTGTNSYELLYLYGANGIAGFTYKKNGSTANYYYRKNLQGDIVAVYGDNGEKCAEYVYDAWGNCTVFLNVNGIATLNPFRYRGYYWDSEFGLYYLNARYYDPEIGRFISQDDISYLDPGTINGLNFYAYCGNNPVINIDPTGHFVLTISAILTMVGICAGIGALFGLGSAVVKDLENGKLFDGDVTFRTYLGEMVGGAVAGAGIGLCVALGAGVGAAALAGEALTIGSFAISGMGAFAISVGASAVSGCLGYVLRTAISDQEEFNLKHMIIETSMNALNGITSYIGGYVGGVTGLKIPGAKLGAKKFLLFHGISLLVGIYTFKMAWALAKNVLKKEFK